jgi:hypothetical protein
MRYAGIVLLWMSPNRGRMFVLRNRVHRVSAYFVFLIRAAQAFKEGTEKGLTVARGGRKSLRIKSPSL